MNQVKLTVKSTKFNDNNAIPLNYLEELINQFQEEIKFTITTIQKPKMILNREPVVLIKALIKYMNTDYIISLNRSTHDDIFLINIEIESQREDDGMFSNFYDLKTDIIKFVKTKVGKVYLMNDTINQKVCTQLYQQIHEVENKFRQLLTDFFTRKMGRYEIAKTLEKSANEFSSWYNSRYKTSVFRSIEAPLFNLTTDNLFNVLKRGFFELETTEKQKLNEKIKDINEFFEEVKWTAEFTVGTRELNDLRRKFDDEYKSYKEKSIFSLYFEDTLKGDFEEKWSDFSKMRNMVAHNKPICKELYEDTLNMCNIINERLKHAQSKLDIMFYSEEELFIEQLNEEELLRIAEIEEQIEYEREVSGLESVWGEDYVVETIGEDKKTESLISILDNYNKVIALTDEYNEIYNEYIDKLSIMNNQEKDKLIIYLEGELNLTYEVEEDTDDDRIFDIKYILNRSILDIESNYEIICDSVVLDYFTLDTPLAKFFDFKGNEYSITVHGEINPEHNGEDTLEMRLMKNDNLIEIGIIDISYGGFDSFDSFDIIAIDPYEGVVKVEVDKIINEVERIIVEITCEVDNKTEVLKNVILGTMITISGK